MPSGDSPQANIKSNGRARWRSNLLKRLFDLLVSLLGLLLLSPFLVLVVIKIRRDSPGPVFYRGPRMGRGGKVFRMVKFRTMQENTESYDGPRVTAHDDERVTRAGRWLRDTKLNELPQLWNVFRGEMSLVGPRPEDPEIVQAWPEDVRGEILSMRPGVTSPASVIYRNEENMLRAEKVMDTYLESILPSKLRLDQLYVRHHSFWLDLDILFWTFLVLLPRVSSYTPPERRLFWGPISKFVRRYMNWFVIDTFVTAVALGTMSVIWRTFTPLNVGWPMAIPVGLSFALLFSIAGALLGTHRITWSRASAMDILDLVFPVILATIAALAISTRHWLGDYPLLPPSLVIVSALLAFAGFIIVRYRSRVASGLATRWLSFRRSALMVKERVLIVGGGQAGQFVVWWLQNGSTASAFRIVGCVDDDLYKQGTRIYGMNVLGQSADIPALVERHDVGMIIFAIHNISAEERTRLLEVCAATPAKVIMLPDILGALNTAAFGDSLSPERGASLARKGMLACHFCLARFSPARMAVELGELEDLAEAGDLAGVQERLRALRQQVGE